MYDRVIFMKTSSRPLRATSAVLSFLILSAAFGCCCLLLILFFAMTAKDTSIAVPSFAAVADTVIIDAGHGGEDGGAVGVNGAFEKDLNLAISRRLAAALDVCGVTVLETRVTDISLHTENIKGQRKNQDLKNRLLVAKEHPDAVFVSIHMNKFPEGKYRGLQVYYSPNHQDSPALGENIRQFTVAYLQLENHRPLKKADDSIYLLSHLSSPGVLVECGFLSNPEECALLSDGDYQQKLALTLAAAISDHLASREAPTLALKP